MMCALASSIVGSAASTVAGPGPEPGTVAVGSCAVSGIVAHAVSVRIHKRATTLGGPVTGGLRGPCGAATQRIACALQPCGTRASPRALYLGVIHGARLRKQATGRCGRRGASPSARSLTDRRGAGCRHGRGRAKRHRSYQGDCGHAHTVILIHSFHLAPLSACQGRRLVLCGGFRPLHYQYEPGQHFLARDFKYFWTAKKEGDPRPWRSLQAKGQARSRNEPAWLGHGHPPPAKRPRRRSFPCFSTYGARIFLAPRSRYSPRNFRMSGSAICGAFSLRRSRASTTHLSRPSRTMPTRSASLWASTKSCVTNTIVMPKR